MTEKPNEKLEVVENNIFSQKRRCVKKKKFTEERARAFFMLEFSVPYGT